MKRVSFFIDGFNLYHTLNCNPNYYKYKWINFNQLAKCYLKTDDTLIDIFYFTAFAIWDQDKVKRHKIFIKAQEIVGIKTIYGKFKIKDRKCRAQCLEEYQTFEEKQTDVNIAIKLFTEAMHDNFDTGIIVTGDSDLVPAIKSIKRNFPAKRIGLIIPIGGKAFYLRETCDYYMKMKEKQLNSSIMPPEIDLGNDEKLIRPDTWQ
jgi:uncharacterized LabA/DUF88 family protein